MNQSLSLRLHSETKDLHRVVEATGAMQRLLRSQMTLDEYRVLLVNLRAVYQCLEGHLEQKSAHPALTSFNFQELKRLRAIDLDLESLGVEPGRGGGLAQLTNIYCARLDSIARSDPRLLIAHAYVRYLGDLHGGQVLARLVTKLSRSTANGLTSTTHFYDFGSRSEVETRITNFRAALDAVPDQHDEHVTLVAEALNAFEFHRQLFATLDRSLAS